MGIFDLIAEFISQYSTAISVTGAVTVVGGTFSYVLVKKIIPAFLERLLKFVSLIIGKMFGVPTEEVSDSIEELPIVNQFKEWEKQLQAQNELKLIEYKKLLVSTKLSDAERVAYQAMFDKILLALGDKVSYATLKALDAIEKAAKEQLGL